jgi:MFS transporter, FHS family, L-fucose permease
LAGSSVAWHWLSEGLGVAELEPPTGTGSGILNIAIVDGAILPVLQRAIVDRVGLHHTFFLPVIFYSFILFYGLSGSKPNSERYAKA